VSITGAIHLTKNRQSPVQKFKVTVTFLSSTNSVVGTDVRTVTYAGGDTNGTTNPIQFAFTGIVFPSGAVTYKVKVEKV
jgi:hypothetical protein